jgi:S-methylmethionine-dependent homocysteine/selenocysteine methylase
MRPADRLAAKLAAGEVVLLDGATGTELQRRGVPMDGEAWCALATLTHPDVLRAVHEGYVRLGCDVVTANTFANARHMMARAGREADTRLAYRRAVEIAREARERLGAGHVAVAGSISTMRPVLKGTDRRDQSSSVPLADARANLREAVDTLAEAGADLLLLEMIGDLDWGGAALEAAVATGLPVWVGTSIRRTEGGEVVSFHQDGPSFPELVRGLAALGPQAIGVMHCAIPDTGPALDALRGVWDGPAMAYPEVGWFEAPDWRFVEIEPAAFAEAALGWVGQGAVIVGGCCGLGPAHIAALAERLGVRLTPVR